MRIVLQILDVFFVQVHQQQKPSPPKRGSGEQDSTGNESPQSYSSQTSTSSAEDIQRRSPIGSVSSSESAVEPQRERLAPADLRMPVPNSALISALTSSSTTPASTAPASVCPVASGASSQQAPTAPRSSHQNKYKTSSSSGYGLPNVLRKLDSPSDSGIDSPQRVQGSQSSSTSVCSSPRSTSASGNEDKAQVSVASAPPPEPERAPQAVAPQIEQRSQNHHHDLEVLAAATSGDAAPSAEASGSSGASAAAAAIHEHPLLKRALEQPPQAYPSTFQDEVYKPHKKFRRSEFSHDGECTSSSSSSAPAPSGSLLASQLQQPPVPPKEDERPSLLSLHLSRGAPAGLSPEEQKRNELIASLILKGEPMSTRHEGLLMALPRGPYNGGSSPSPAYHGSIHRSTAPPSSTVTSGSYERDLASSGDPGHHQDSKLASLADACAAAQRHREPAVGAGANESQPLNLSTTSAASTSQSA